MDRSREHTAAFTGHRRYDGECDDALRAVVRELYGRGFRVFWSGMALGFDLAAAEAVLALRGELPGLRLCCAVPFPGQADRFPEADRLRYMRILDRADEVATLAPRYEPRCYLRRDEFMVERSAARRGMVRRRQGRDALYLGLCAALQGGADQLVVRRSTGTFLRHCGLFFAVIG